MKLILLSTPFYFVEEHQILNALFDEGLELLHLRKPNTDSAYLERLITLIKEPYRKQIVIHDHFYLKEEYNLKGIHLNRRNPNAPQNYKGSISCSCHSADEVVQVKRKFDYLFLSPIFNSISKQGYSSNFTTEQLRELSKKKVIDRKVMALGGVCSDNISSLKDFDFGGAVVLGDVWNHFDQHSAQDFTEVIQQYRKLQKAIN